MKLAIIVWIVFLCLLVFPWWFLPMCLGLSVIAAAATIMSEKKNTKKGK